MTERTQEIKQIATQLLAGMLANPHIYSIISDEEGKGQREQILLSNAITMAEQLLEKVEHWHGSER